MDPIIFSLGNPIAGKDWETVKMAVRVGIALKQTHFFFFFGG